ncbi:hypothetical protein NM208_g5024 [Fusarium decemcellulare]|uniref:Uncharacterized protein n=1 Tax=Fusarium decemcellulare TaxID=57161 RepID=A0ACC1SIJ0_9HYPO|nr:hypothetical protein NM208_g5024 [Fusarium decemcellulare]
MTTPRNTALFQPEYDAKSAESLLVLVRHLEITSHNMAKETPSTDQAKTLVGDIGEYLIQAAQAWAQLTDALVESRQIQQAVLDAHEQARSRNHLSDLSTVVAMDVDLSKLSKIRDLTAQFSRDVNEVWRSGSGRGGSAK